MNRKWFFVLLMGILVLSLAACTGTSEVPEEEMPQPTPTTVVMDTDDSHDNDTDAETESDDADQDNDAEAVSIDAAAIFSARCSSCHGTDRQGANAPPLLPANLTKDASSYVNTITNGSGPMPSWEGRLSAEEINAMVEFILSEVE